MSGTYQWPLLMEQKGMGWWGVTLEGVEGQVKQGGRGKLLSRTSSHCG